MCASKCLKDDYLKLGVAKENIFKVPNGVDMKRFNNSYLKRKYKKNKKIKLLAVGRNDPKKNYQSLIKCFEIVQLKSGNKYELTILGEIHQVCKTLL